MKYKIRIKKNDPTTIVNGNILQERIPQSRLDGRRLILEKTKLNSNVPQQIVDDLQEFSAERQMVINSMKTCVRKICKSRSKAFPTEIKIDDSFLEVKKEMKVLGVILQPNLK